MVKENNTLVFAENRKMLIFVFQWKQLQWKYINNNSKKKIVRKRIEIDNLGLRIRGLNNSFLPGKIFSLILFSDRKIQYLKNVDVVLQILENQFSQKK